MELKSSIEIYTHLDPMPMPHVIVYIIIVLDILGR